MGSPRFEANDIDRLLAPGRSSAPSGNHPLTGWSDVAHLLESLRAAPSRDEVAGEAQAVLSIAALIRSNSAASPSNLAAVRHSERNRPRSWTEKFAASVIAVALATTTGLVVVGVFPHSGGRSAAGVETSTGTHEGVRIPESADRGPSPRSAGGRLSHERSRFAVSPETSPVKTKTKAQGTGAPRPAQTRGSGSGSGTGSGTGTGSDQGGGHTWGGDRGQGKDRGQGNDDRLIGGGGHRKSESRPSRSGGHHN